MNPKFRTLSKTELQDLEEKFVNYFHRRYCRKETVDGVFLYEINVPEMNFALQLTDDKLREIIYVAFEIVEEMKAINNNGLTREKYAQISYEIRSQETDDEIISFMLWKTIASDKMYQLIEKADGIIMIRGPYAYRLANPEIECVIRAIYELKVDDFGDLASFSFCSYALICILMRVSRYSNE